MTTALAPASFLKLPASGNYFGPMLGAYHLESPVQAPGTRFLFNENLPVSYPCPDDSGRRERKYEERLDRRIDTPQEKVGSHVSSYSKGLVKLPTDGTKPARLPRSGRGDLRRSG